MTSSTDIAPPRRHLFPANVAFGLSGNNPGFLAEFEVALKSVLMNAPDPRPCRFGSLREPWWSREPLSEFVELSTWVTQHPVEIHCYNVTPLLPWLEREIIDSYSKSLPNFELWHGTVSHTIGCFFRLMVHKVVCSSVRHLLYMDTDVVIMANLEQLWREVEVEPDALFHWGKTMCSGFVVMNVPRMDELWKLAGSANMTKTAEAYDQDSNDRLLYMTVNMTYPDQIGVLPDGWDMTATNLWQEDRREIAKTRPDTGMLHMNGGQDSKDAYWTNHEYLNTSTEEAKNIFGPWINVMHYVKTPWTWARGEE